MRARASLVPGFFTMANMFCGYYSILLAAQGRFTTAAWLIIAAGVLDVLDGKLARMVDGASEFGVQYDSLADVISFGLAPSALSYYVLFQEWGTTGLMLSFVPLVFGAIRLARFNARLEGFDKDAFEGVPSPAAAITICTFVLFNYDVWGELRWEKIFMTIVLLVSILMITNIRYEIMPNFSLQSSRINRLKILAVIIGIIIILIYPQRTFFPLIMIYILSGPIRIIWLLIFSQQEKASVSKTKERK